MKTSRTLKIGLLLSAIISMIIGFSMMNNLITANAQVSSAGGKSFYVEGAAVRLSDDFADNGVSFHIIIDKTFTPESYNVYKKYFDDDGLLKEGVTTGTIVAPAKYVITESFTKDTVLVAPDSTVIANIDTTAVWVDYTVGAKEYKKSIAYIYNIPEAYYTVDLVVAGYITDGTDTVYTKKSEPFSLCWVAVEEYEDSNSRLTPEQKEGLREDYIENYGEEYTVSYYDGDTLLGQEDCLYGKGLSADAPKIEGKYFVGYASKEMEPYRYTIDLIADFVIETNPEASKTNEAFRKELREKQERLQEKMGGWYQAQSESELDRVQNLKGYEEVFISNKSLHTVEALEFDYRRRIGNTVLRHVRELQKETFERGKRTHYKTNDKRLKCGIRISERKIKRLNDKFFSAVIDTFLPETRSYHNRLHEIEEELEEKKKQEEWENEQEELKRSKYYWSK